MVEDQTKGVSPPQESGDVNGLTCIRGRIHCGATQQGETLRDTDRIQLDHFFDVLADVALSVANRSLTNGQVTEPCEQ